MAKTNAIECGECGETGWHAETCCLYTGPVKPHRIGAVDRCSACAPDVGLEHEIWCPTLVVKS